MFISAMKSSARTASLLVALLLTALGALATAPPPAATLEFQYRGTQLPPENRDSLERSLRQELQPAHPVRMVVTITDREIKP
jgi:uncharacterized membrane protein